MSFAPRRVLRRRRAALLPIALAAIAEPACTALVGLDGDYVEGVGPAASGDASALGDATPLPEASVPPEPKRDASVEDSGGDAAPPEPPSCRGLAPTCGPSGTERCCATAPVPGGTFRRLNRNTNATATVSPFALERFEVTVGRFRAFVEAGQGTQEKPPAEGAGAHPKVAGSGWKAAYNAQLPTTTAQLVGRVGCAGGTYTALAGANESLPVTCVDWFVAMAFCAWDEARLPSEAEMSFAQVGGSEQRVFPWSVPPTSDTIDASFAVYATTAAAKVGSRSPKGDGRFGHSDLVGNANEWVLDGLEDPFPATACTDCVLGGASPQFRVRRGSGFDDPAGELRNDYRFGNGPANVFENTGMRCVR